MRINVESMFSLDIVAARGVELRPSQNPPTLNVVPRPASVKSLAGSFTLDDQTRILAVDKESRRIARLFNDFLLEQHGSASAHRRPAPRSELHLIQPGRQQKLARGRL